RRAARPRRATRKPCSRAPPRRPEGGNGRRFGVVAQASAKPGPPLGREPPDADQMLLVVRRVERADLDAAPAFRRVHEPAAAEVDADVRQLLLVLKEHEIAGLRG